jgi:hypothetical protein
MKHKDLIKPIILIFAAILLIISFLTGKSIDTNLLRWTSGITSTITILWFIYERWIWRYSIFQKLSHYHFKTPVIHGTWKGTLAYQTDANGKEGEVDIYLSIQQTLTTIQIRAFFEKPSQSYSIASVIQEAPNGTLQLQYIYRSEAPYNGRENNRPHDGTVILEIIGEPVKELRGSYFTERKGSGEIVLKQHSTTKAESLESAKILF